MPIFRRESLRLLLITALLVRCMPTLTWRAVSGSPSQYVIEIAPDLSFDSGLLTATVNAPVLSYTVTAAQALPNGEYYWRILARDAAGSFAPSLARAFTIATP